MNIRNLLAGALVLVPAAIASADGGCPFSNPNPAPSAPVAPTASAALGSHGGSIVVLGTAGNQFEVVQDASLGRVTVYAIASPSRTIVVSQAPVIALEGRKELTLVAVPGETNVWAVTDDSLKGGSLAGRLMVRTSDRWETAALTVPVSAATRATENPAPAVPTAWNEPMAAHGGRVLAACGGSFEWVRDAATGRATLFLLPQGQSKLTLDADPLLSVKSAAGDARTLAMTAVPGATGAWEVTVDVFKGDAAADGTVKVSIDGRPCELNLRDASTANGSSLRLPDAAPPAANPKADEAPAGDANPPAPEPVQPEVPKNDAVKDDASAQPATSALVFGGGIAKLDLRRDAALGRLTLTTPSGVRAARLDGAPVLVLETPAGKKELTFEKGSTEGTWTVTSEELKATSPMKGVVRITIEGKQLEADTAPQFADAKPTPSEMR